MSTFISKATKESSIIVQQIKRIVKTLPCLGIPDPNANLIVESDASDLGYGGVVEQVLPNS